MSAMTRMIVSFAILALISGAVLPMSASGVMAPDDGSKVIAVIPLNTAGGIQGMYRQVDRIVPKLRALSQEKIVRLECRYSGRADREQDVVNAYALAGKIEKYLRERHRLNLDLWIGARLTGQGRGPAPALTFSVFSDDIRRLEKLPVAPAKKGQDSE